MKFFLLISLVFPALTLQRTPAALKCELSSDKKVYKKGELPKLTVKIINDSEQDIYLIGSLDGSDVQWRFPYCYYSITGPRPKNTAQGRCGNMNTLRVKDFKSVKAGETFDTYETIDGYGFFTDHIATDKETFKTPGEYRIQFNYSTNAKSISDFTGDHSRYNTDSLQIDSMFKAVPRVELKSNEIVIRVEK